MVEALGIFGRRGPAGLGGMVLKSERARSSDPSSIGLLTVVSFWNRDNWLRFGLWSVDVRDH